jgi:hypothetical protein
MLVGQWMTKDPLTIGPKESIVTARAVLRHGHLLRCSTTEMWGGDRTSAAERYPRRAGSWYRS